MEPAGNVKRKPLVELKSQGAVEKLMSADGGAAVIDFWAPWCAPCRATAPHFEAAATDYAGQPVQFCKLNTESHPNLAAAFNVRALPTMMFILNGEVLDVAVGMMDKARLVQKVEWLMSKGRGETFWDRLVGKRKAPVVDTPASET